VDLPLIRTVDGFDAHLGTNHLGHFALTCLLGDKIKDRVISVASAMYLVGRIHFDDLNWHTRRYSTTAAYSESKLANLLFVLELANRGVRAYASDPGMTDTGITRRVAAGIPMAERSPVWHLLHTPAQGARASVQALTNSPAAIGHARPRNAHTRCATSVHKMLAKRGVSGGRHARSRLVPPARGSLALVAVPLDPADTGATVVGGDRGP
jgi:NAD(P)-dependent dehydrogenase (short-subunit alcohol dehydrogenase family)